MTMKFLYPNDDPDQHQNLMDCPGGLYPTIHLLLCELYCEQINEETPVKTTSLAEVIIIQSWFFF